MTLIILGRSLIFWSGIIAGIFLILYFLTCYISPIKCSAEKRTLLCKIHHKLKWPAYLFTGLHIILALLGSLGGIYF